MMKETHKRGVAMTSLVRSNRFVGHESWPHPRLPVTVADHAVPCAPGTTLSPQPARSNVQLLLSEA